MKRKHVHDKGANIKKNINFKRLYHRTKGQVNRSKRSLRLQRLPNVFFFKAPLKYEI